MTYLLLIIGFLLLIKGADWFVDGSASIASIYKISPLIIGLTIVAFGTGAPEATVSIIAALEGNADVTIGNIVGSNILNLSFVVGLTAVIYPLKVQSVSIRKEIPFAFLSAVVLLALLFESTSDDFLYLITRSDGVILLLFFSIFMYYVIEAAKNSRNDSIETAVESVYSLKKSIVYSILGLIAIIIGGYLVVETSTTIAYQFGMSETLVGLTIVAIGSSLPELVTSIAAAMKKHSEMALGNVVGSSIFNVFFVLGLSSVITPLTVVSIITIDIIALLILTLMLFIFSRTSYTIGKTEGLILSLSYISYLIYIIIRN
ncbi:calcium/sodium antiporter [Bacillus sp. JCM 19034]|uniref:calcium/sodium antiporter n=1 Tax=Bacillus sp. JCM 19034 TaxID=1481928 RepID=UPI000783C0FC|nr:calcium/sodium antiporter [Bacillus sp. JCM 19034]